MTGPALGASSVRPIPAPRYLPLVQLHASSLRSKPRARYVTQPPVSASSHEFRTSSSVRCINAWTAPIDAYVH